MATHQLITDIMTVIDDISENIDSNQYKELAERVMAIKNNTIKYKRVKWQQISVASYGFGSCCGEDENLGELTWPAENIFEAVFPVEKSILKSAASLQLFRGKVGAHIKPGDTWYARDDRKENVVILIVQEVEDIN